MLFRRFTLLFIFLSLTASIFAQEKTIRNPEQPGLQPIGSAYFPIPPGMTVVPMSNCGFEQIRDEKAEGWSCQEGVTVVTSAVDAPEGTHFLRVPAKNGCRVFSSGMTLEPNRQYLLSFWLRSTGEDTHFIGFNQVKGTRYIAEAGSRFAMLPNTGGKWKRVGFYFHMMTVPCEAVWIIDPRNDVDGATFDFDDVELRTATETEYTSAFWASRKQLPPHDITPRPDDGRNLALTIAKLEGKGVPGKPFLIWAIGSSWTNGLGDGEVLTEIIKRRFPHAPELLYRKHAGSGTPWDYARGWARTFVLAEQPDLILTYTNGDPEKLALMLKELRQTTTADIIVASLHFFKYEKLESNVIDDTLSNRTREVCAEYGVEFIENRRELAVWLAEQTLAHADLLADAVHENSLGQWITNENIGRHFAHPKAFSYTPTSREWSLPATAGLAQKLDGVKCSDFWSIDGNRITANKAGASIEIRMKGIRIDLTGLQQPNGGTLNVQVDGKPVNEAPAFFVGFITARNENARPVGPAPSDVGPQGVLLGNNVLPQQWTITMTNDTGDFQVTGSITGIDGSGNCLKPFTSTSGQLILEPALWRHALDLAGNHINKTGDTWRFEVFCANPDNEITFRSNDDKKKPFFIPVVMNLPAGVHTVTLTVKGDGPVSIDRFYVYRPPLGIE